METYRKCAISGCDVRVLTSRLMCVKHYYLLPRPHRFRLNSNYIKYTHGLPGSLEKLRAVQAECVEKVTAQLIAEAAAKGRVWGLWPEKTTDDDQVGDVAGDGPERGRASP